MSVLDNALQQSMKDQVKEITVWDNAAPTSSFPAQTILAELKDAKFIKVLFNTTIASDGEQYENMVEIEANSRGYFQSTVNVGIQSKTKYFAQRTIQATDTGVTFGKGKTVEVGADGSVDTNNYCIPKKNHQENGTGGYYLKLKKYLQHLVERRCWHECIG